MENTVFFMCTIVLDCEENSIYITAIDNLVPD
jgi:hypothetical protein